VDLGCGQATPPSRANGRGAALTNGIVEIRYYAYQGPEHLARIHEHADIVHNLPGGILGGGERRKEPYGYRTFR
jgi:hypothetical protein